ncbi:MAG: hypothetical protein RR603_04220, partial [Kurthia sp.]
GSYPKGKEIKLVAYHTDVKDFNANNSRWFRISYAGKQGWVRSDQVKIENIAFTTKEAVSYKSASATSSKVETLPQNTPVQLSMKNNKVV